MPGRPAPTTRITSVSAATHDASPHRAARASKLVKLGNPVRCRRSDPTVHQLREALVTDREIARAEMLDVLGSRRYTALLRRLATAVSGPLPAGPGRAGAAALVDLVRAEYRRLSKAVRAAGQDPPDEVLHALRIHGKRLRYTGELAFAAGRKPVRRLVESTVALQDVLGEHQDACVAQRRVRLLLDGLGDVVDVGVAFAAGRLVEREELSRVETRQAWLAAWQQVQERARSLEKVA